MARTAYLVAGAVVSTLSLLGYALPPRHRTWWKLATAGLGLALGIVL